jgi:phosphoenolpyruvate carboxylase
MFLCYLGCINGPKETNSAPLTLAGHAVSEQNAQEHTMTGPFERARSNIPARLDYLKELLDGAHAAHTLFGSWTAAKMAHDILEMLNTLEASLEPEVYDQIADRHRAIRGEALNLFRNCCHITANQFM